MLRAGHPRAHADPRRLAVYGEAVAVAALPGAGGKDVRLALAHGAHLVRRARGAAGAAVGRILHQVDAGGQAASSPAAREAAAAEGAAAPAGAGGGDGDRAHLAARSAVVGI